MKDLLEKIKSGSLSQAQLKTIVISTDLEGVRNEERKLAIQHIEDEEFLFDQAIKDHPSHLRLTGHSALSTGIKKIAVSKISDQTKLKKIVRLASDSKVRKAAFKKIQSID